MGPVPGGIEVGERQMATASSCGLVFRGQIRYSKDWLFEYLKSPYCEHNEQNYHQISVFVLANKKE